MEQIIITRANGAIVPIANKKTATSIKSASQNITLLGDDTVSIVVVSPFKQTYLLGDTINIYGNPYRLNRLPKVRKNGMHEFQYELEFEGMQYDMMRVTYDLTIDTTNNKLADVSAESLTGSLHRFATVLISNMNRVFPGKWVLGTCPDTAEDKTLTFAEGDNCLSVVQNLCTEYETEFDIENNVNTGVCTLNFRKVGKTFPYKFEFGRNKGLYQLTRENVSSANIVTRLKVYGSTENITYKYRAQRLCLPGKSKTESYIEKPEAIAKYGIWEGRKYFDNIKPSRTGKVTGLVEGSVLKFVDADMFDLNLKDENGNSKYLLADTAAKVHFNTGNLAGYEFDVHSYDHATHTFTLVKQTDERGNVFPSDSSDAFQFAEGNEYKLIDVALPPEWERKAEKELEEQGNIYYDQNSQPKVQYGLSATESFLASLLSKETNGNVIWVGDYIPVKDADIDVDKAVRVKSFKRDLLKDYSYTLIISDLAITTSVTNRVISELIEHDKAITINNLKDPARARANWRSSREVLNMVFDPEGDYYTDKIKPLSIDTMALSVGAKSMQFGLKNTVFQPNYGGDANRIVYDGGVLTHYTIKEESAVSWVLADGDVSLSDSAKAYYIYAKCQKEGDSGNIIFSSEQIKTNSDAMYYHFFIGVLNSVDPELKARSLALTYGFTMINGRFIKTGRVESADGTTYFDLDNSEIGGRIVFTRNGEKKTLEEVADESLESKNFINNTLPGLLENIQQQLDGQIEQFFYNTDPSPLSTQPNATDGIPNSEWTETITKEAHLGDLYYNTDSGKVWRYVKMQWRPKPGFAPGTFYVWQELQDSDLAQAIAIANEALELGKEKNRIFTTQPVPPYDMGDLWVQGATGDIMRCKTARESGAYTASDWEKASKYTDDSGLNKFINGAFSDAIDTMTEQIDGKIETWFQTTDPAKNWSTNTEKAKHIGDMWYNSNTKLLKCYRQTFFFVNGVGTVIYIWQTIEDKKAIDAYDAASKAQDTADGKRRVFVAQPYPPYDEGDLWVDGKELRRCITARASGSWNINDWVVAVYYDNTQTTIDGGIVTSGTIQVAGDNKSILAGITGNGTAANSIRFWAGASFENRATAPFRVMQDGSVVMSKAQVEGVINAISGSIGGFRIQQGQIGYGTDKEQDSAEGLALLKDFVRFRRGNQLTLLGCLSSLGYPFNGLMELTDTMGTTLELHHDNPKTSDERNEWMYRPKALGVFGNQYNFGKTASFETGYIGEAYTNIIQLWFNVTQKYQFESNSTSRLAVRLPTKQAINDMCGNKPVIFDLEIVCGKDMANLISIMPDNGKTTQLYRGSHPLFSKEWTGGFNSAKLEYQIAKVNGKTVDSYDMVAGDSVRLRYCNGVFYILDSMAEYKNI